MIGGNCHFVRTVFEKDFFQSPRKALASYLTMGVWRSGRDLSPLMIHIAAAIVFKQRVGLIVDRNAEQEQTALNLTVYLGDNECPFVLGDSAAVHVAVRYFHNTDCGARTIELYTAQLYQYHTRNTYRGTWYFTSKYYNKFCTNSIIVS